MEREGRRDLLDRRADLRAAHRADVRELRARRRVDAPDAEGQRRRVHLGRSAAGARPAVPARDRGAGARWTRDPELHLARRHLPDSRREDDAGSAASWRMGSQPAHREAREAGGAVEPLSDHGGSRTHHARGQRQGRVGRARHHAAQGLHRARVRGRAGDVPQPADSRAAVGRCAAGRSGRRRATRAIGRCTAAWICPAGGRTAPRATSRRPTGRSRPVARAARQRAR